MLRLRHIGSKASDAPRTVSLDKAEIVVGRKEGAVDVFLNSGMISRKHATINRFVASDGVAQFEIQDVGSTNGTTLNGRFLEQPEVLSTGDEVVFGGDTDEMREAFRYLVEEVGGSTGSSEGSFNLNPFISEMLQEKKNALPARPRANCEPPAPAAQRHSLGSGVAASPPSIEVQPATPTAAPAEPVSRPRTQSEKGRFSPVLERKESVSQYSGKALEQVLSGGRVNGLDMLMSAAGNVDSMVISQQQLEKLFGSNPALRNKKKPSSKEKKNRLSQATEAVPAMRLSGDVLEDWFCEKASVLDLDNAVAKGVDCRRVNSSSRSPFSIAINAKNLEFAMRLAHHLGGEVSIANCDLQEVPKPVTRMVQTEIITKLDISNNNIDTIPASLGVLSKLVYTGNPLKDLPEHHRDGRWPALKKYLSHILSLAENWNVRKMSIVGPTSCGKTSLLRSLVSKSGSQKASVGSEPGGNDVHLLPMENFDIRAWDMGSRIVSTPTHKFFLTSGSLNLVVFNACKPQLARIEYWLKQLKTTTSDKATMIVLVGTHADTLAEGEANTVVKKLKTKFPRHVYPQVKDIVMVSSRTGDGIATLKKKLVELCSHTSFLTEVSPSWAQLYLKVQQMLVNGVSVIDYATFKEWVLSVGVSKRDTAKVADFLVQYGAMLHYQEAPDMVVVDPDFLAAVTAKMLQMQEFSTFQYWEVPGFVTNQDMKLMLRDKEPYVITSVLALLLHFRMMILVKRRESFFVPCMLPDQRPSGQVAQKGFPPKIPECETCYARVFQFRQVPFNLFDRILVSMLSMKGMTPTLQWQLGMVMDRGEHCKVFVEYFPDSYRVMMELRFKTADHTAHKISLVVWRDLLAMIRTQVESFCGSTSWEELVPCTHCIKQGVFRDNVYLFSYQEVIDSTSPFVYCHGIQSPCRCLNKTRIAPDITLLDLPQVNEARMRIGKQLGEGGFGIVYKGTLGGKVVAVKELTLHQGQTLDENLFKEFQIEAYVQGLLDHPNCVKLYGLTSKPPRMVLEFVSGGDLCHKVLHVEPRPTLESLPWSRRLQIAWDIAKGLHHMQTRDPPIIHRDLRSPNVFMSKSGKAYIGDFGLSRVVNPDVGGMLGTWQWLAPECIESREDGEYDERADIYSFGIVMLELCTCEIPFQEYSTDPRFTVDGKIKVQQIKRAIIDDGLRPTVPSHAPGWFADLIRRCLVHQPQDRPSSAMILTEIANNTGRGEELRVELQRAKTTAEDARWKTVPLDSIIVPGGASTATSVTSTEVTGIEGLPRLVLAVDECAWVASSKGSIAVYKYQQESTFKTVAVQTHCWQAHLGRISDFVRINDRVWTCSEEDMAVSIWDTRTFESCDLFLPFGQDGKGSGPTLLCSADAPSGPTVWVASPQQARIMVYSVAQQAPVATLEDDQLRGTSAMAVHNGCMWVGSEGNILMYDLTNTSLIGSFKAHNTGRMPMSITVVDKVVWTAASCECKIWDAASLETLRLRKSVQVGEAKIEALVMAEGGRMFTGAFNGELVMWDPLNGTPEQAVIPEEKSSIKDICYSPTSGGLLWAVTSTGVLHVFHSSYLHNKLRPVKRQHTSSAKRTIRQKEKSLRKPGFAAMRVRSCVIPEGVSDARAAMAELPPPQ